MSVISVSSIGYIKVLKQYLVSAVQSCGYDFGLGADEDFVDWDVAAGTAEGHVRVSA